MGGQINSFKKKVVLLTRVMKFVSRVVSEYYLVEYASLHGACYYVRKHTIANSS